MISCNSVFRRGNGWIIATIEFRSFNFDLRLELKEGLNGVVAFTVNG